MLDPSHPAARARELHDAERTRTRTQVEQFSKRHAGRTIGDSDAIQRAGMDIERAEGRVAGGRKIGLTSRAMQLASQITEPDHGHSRSVDAGDTVECEITKIGRVGGTVVAVDALRAAALGVGHAPTDSPEVRRVACGFDERVPERLKDNLRRTRSEGSAT